MNQLGSSSSRGPREGLAEGSHPELLALAVLLGQPGLGRDRTLEALAAPSVGCHFIPRVPWIWVHLQHPA